MASYADFLAAKQRRHGTYGAEISADTVSSALHDWQREGVAWAVRKGRAAFWWSTGLGKTRAQLEWARLSTEGMDGRGLIVAPLAVCEQTVREATRIGIEAACPLQLDLIERCVRLWSNPGETVFTPFAGIGSEPYVAVKNGRIGMGIELKPSYFAAAVANLKRAEATAGALTLFDAAEA